MYRETLSEFLDDQSLFEAISEREGFPFINSDNLHTLDLMLKISFGERKLFPAYKTASIGQVADILVLTYADAWNSYVEIQALSSNLNKRRELTETINENESRTNSREDVNKVTGFDSPEFIDNDGSNSSGEDTRDGETTRTLIDENVDPSVTFNLLNQVNQASIMSKVVKDVATTLTLSIY